jgi:hypothetical protein
MFRVDEKIGRSQESCASSALPTTQLISQPALQPSSRLATRCHHSSVSDEPRSTNRQEAILDVVHMARYYGAVFQVKGSIGWNHSRQAF